MCLEMMQHSYSQDEGSQAQLLSSQINKEPESACAEGVVRFVVPKVSKLEGAAASKTVEICGFPWRLVMAPREAISSSQDGRSKALGVFLQCVPHSPSPREWSVPVQASLVLVNQADAGKSYFKDFRHCFSAQQSDWGYTTFMKWKTLTDPARGFIQEDTIILEARITAECTHTPDSPVAAVGPPSLLSCPTCCCDYCPQGNNQPMSLRCGHTFCLECLQKSYSQKGEDKGQIKCTICGQEHSSPDAGETKPWFPNYSLMHIIGNVIPKPKHFCGQHQHDKTYYCLQDETLVCIHCAYHGSHSNHTCRHMDEAKRLVKEKLQEGKSQAVSRLSELERSVQLLRDEEKCLRLQEQSVGKLVEDFFGGIVTALQRQKEHLLKEVGSHVSEVVASVREQTRELEVSSDNAREVVDEYSTWQTLPTQDALANVATLQSKLKSLSETNANTAPACSSPKITFELPCSDILTSIGQLGRVCVGAKPKQCTDGKGQGSGIHSDGQEDGGGESTQVMKTNDSDATQQYYVGEMKPPAKRKKTTS